MVVITPLNYAYSKSCAVTWVGVFAGMCILLTAYALIVGASAGSIASFFCEINQLQTNPQPNLTQPNCIRVNYYCACHPSGNVQHDCYEYRAIIT